MSHGLAPQALYGANYNSSNFLNQKSLDSDRVFLIGYDSFFLKPSLLSSLDNNQEKNDFLFSIQDQLWQYLYNHGFKFVLIQKSANFDVVGRLENDPRPDWLEIIKIYSDQYADIYFLTNK